MSRYHLVLLPGDGTGPEVMAQAEKVLDTIEERGSVHFERERIPCGGRFYLEHGSRDWPEGAEERCAAADLILLGAVGWPSPEGKGPVLMADGKMAGYSPVIGNRTRLDLYANVRPVKLYPSVPHKIHGKNVRVWEEGRVDMVFIRENTEGLYAPVGGVLAPGNVEKVAIDTRVITREGAERVIRFAFETCRKKKSGAPADGKKRVTCIVKDNVLKGCQLFAKIFFEIGEEYPEIEKETAIVDAFTQWLISRPEYYDVLVTTNMFGDIVTDLASVLQGGMGMAVGGNIGDTHAMFEPIHGSAPKHAGKDRVNPLAMILAVKDGLAWLGERKEDPELLRISAEIEGAVIDLLQEGRILTYDLVGPERAARCSEVGDEVCRKLATRLDRG